MIELYQSSWNGVAFDEIVRETGIDPSQVADHHFYAAFYSRLRQNKFQLDASWVEEKRLFTPWMQRFFDARRAEKKGACEGISIGAGIGIVEEPLLTLGYRIALQECQGESFEYLRRKGIAFEEVIGKDLSSVPSEAFDLAFLFGVSYVFSADAYRPFLGEVARILRPGATLLMWDPLAPLRDLPMLRTVRTGIKRVIGRRGRDQVLWGWLRTPAEHRAALEGAGLRVERTFFLNRRAEAVDRPFLPLGLTLPNSSAVTQWALARRAPAET